MAAAGTGWYLWRPKATVEVPTVDPAGAEPEVIAAIKAASAGVRRSPRSAAAWGRLGKVFFAHAYYDEAGTCFARAEELEPKDARWPYLYGMVLYATDTDGGIASFRRAVRLKGDSPGLRLRLAEALLSQGRLDAAEEQYRWLLDLDPDNPRGYLGLGRLAYRRGDLKTCRKYLARTLDSPLTRKAAHTLLAEVEQRSQKPTAAARERYRAAELPDDQDWPDPLIDEVDQLKAHKRARLNVALKLFEQERVAAALDLLHKLERDYPDWDQVWLSYGRIMFVGRNYDAAEEALRKALRLAPDCVQAHFYLGLVQFDRKDYAAAAASFREATRLKPDYARAYYNLGQCLKGQGDRARALDAFRQAVRSRQNYAAAYTELGTLLAERGDKSEAIRNLRLALELNPDDAAAKRLLRKLRQGK
jgi:tetratricopeptide (TPR) repeat protein